ncbi:MAG: acyl transferase [Bacteroidetes bacterium]|nr:MAG: acyl transferase [Bacteroidota bacterium]
MNSEWHDKIFSVTESRFRQLALDIFHFQYEDNKVYNSYVNALGISPSTVDEIEKIPFLPISFFKTDEIKTGKFNAEVIFKSSGTTQTINSQHHVKDMSFYTQSFTRAFKNIYGDPQWCVLGLLPSYLEKGNSSLVYMVDSLIKQSRHPQSGFYLYNLEKLKETLLSLERANQKTLLIGVTYALLDFAEKFSIPLANTIIMETGGMKGRREELTRMEVHDQLKKAFGQTEIHSEYGMTELLSQAYAKKEGRFQCPPWMKVLIRDDEDPLSVWSSEPGVGNRVGSQRLLTPNSELRTIAGAINIIDLANVHSCSFIATDDVGKLYPDQSFEVLGRMDGSDLRGCSLLTV